MIITLIIAWLIPLLVYGVTIYKQYYFMMSGVFGMVMVGMLRFMVLFAVYCTILGVKTIYCLSRCFICFVFAF